MGIFARTPGLKSLAEKGDDPSIVKDEDIKYPNDNNNNNAGNDSDSESETQHGVRAAEAILQCWTKRDMIIAYILVWLIQFMMSFASGVIVNLTPFVTSSFQQHALTGLTTVISSAISGIAKLPYTKIIDIWGRPQGYAIMILSFTVGVIMMAGCNNVQTYCAAQVFYQIGYMGISFSNTIFVADTSELRNRAFMISFIASPYLATTWITGPAADSILSTIGFRWGFGVWCIVIPLTCSPLCGLFYYYERKAHKLGLVKRIDSGRTFTESLYYYAREFDVIGLLMISTGVSLFLLAFNLYSYQADQWRAPLIIAFIIVGGVLIIAFAFYERYLAPVTFMPWKLIANRTVFFTYTMAASIYVAWYLWNNYFYSYLLVVYGLDVTRASYIMNIYTIGSTFWSIVMGVLLRYHGRLKYISLFFGIPITVLGVGLMIHFRQPDVNIGFIVMCQIFIAFGGGTLVIAEQMTVMAVAPHQFVAAVLAMEGMFINIGSAIGSTVSVAIWTGVFPAKLQQYLPESAMENFASIYGDMTVQSSYPFGSPERDAINRSYSESQRYMLIAATCMYSITLVSTLFWEDVNVKKIKQLKKGGVHF